MLSYIPLVLSLIKYIPDVVKTVEVIHGPAPTQGPSKLQAAINLLSMIVPDLADALKLDPKIKDILTQVINFIVMVMNDKNTMPAPVVDVVVPIVK